MEVKGLVQKIIGTGVKGAGIAAGVYLGIQQEDLALAGIVGAGGYVIGSLIEKLGYEMWFEKRGKEFKQKVKRDYDEKVRGLKSHIMGK